MKKLLKSGKTDEFNFTHFHRIWKLSMQQKNHACAKMYVWHLYAGMLSITPGTDVVRNIILENNEKYLKWLKLRWRGGQNHFVSKHFSWKIQDGEIQVLYVYVNISAENRCIGMFDGLMKSWDSARQHGTIEKMIKRKNPKIAMYK